MPEWAALRDEALEIVSGARDVDVTLRVVGGAGLRLHCAAAGRELERLGRAAKDIDLIVPKDLRRGMRRYLESRGYEIDRDLLVAMEGRRYSFSHPDTEIELDVFVERLEFNHTVEVRGRLEAHPVTLTIEDLLLQKLQIVHLTPNDLLDITVLLGTHRVVEGSGTVEEVSGGYIAALLSKDWGFHHTAVRNLERFREGVGTPLESGDPLEPMVRQRAEELLATVSRETKSLGWRVRAKVGERVQWWEDVDEREETY